MKNVIIENLTVDHNYWMDCYISYAEHDNGEPLDDEELESIDDDTLYHHIMWQLYY